MKGRILHISTFIAYLILALCLTACGGSRSENLQETNDTTKELVEQVESGDIIVSMSIYSNNEQVGSLERSYTGNDKQITTHNGDIVLYNGNNIVVFYGSNSWSYTRLGKMDISEHEVIELLSNGDVELKISKE